MLTCVCLCVFCVCVYRCGGFVRAPPASCAFGATAERGRAGEGAPLWHRPHPAGCWAGSRLQHCPAGDGGKTNAPKYPKTQQMHSNNLVLTVCVCVCVCLQYDHHRVSMLANRLVQKVMSEIPDVILNGDPQQRYPGTPHTHTQE